MEILNLKTGTFVNILHKFREEGTNIMKYSEKMMGP